MANPSYKAALVTGAAARLGRAMSLGLAERGVDIALHYNSNATEAEKTAEEIRARSTSASVWS